MSFSVLQMNLLRRYFLVLNFFHHSVKYGNKSVLIALANYYQKQFSNCCLNYSTLLPLGESLSTDDGTSKLALCPGDILIYNCTLMGTPGGVTVWQGEAFDCQNSEISLLHGLFTSQDGATGECNDGDIVARSLGVEDNHYTSQLRVTVSTAITGKTITCVYDTSSGNSLPQFNITIPTLITGSPARIGQ